MASTEMLLTAEEFQQLPDTDGPRELVKGHVVRMNFPWPRHGEVCCKVAIVLHDFVKQSRSGRVVTNDSAVITQRDPDTVRGADVAYYSYDRVPAGPLPSGYLAVPPDAVFEVLSPTDRRADVLAKVAEYLKVGVRVVCVVDWQAETVQVHYPDKPLQLLGNDDELNLPGVIDSFRVRVASFFESM